MMTILIFTIGLLIGSFLNVCIYRLPIDKSIARPRSHCIQCKTTLNAIDLIPVLSWIFLRGKCRHCGVNISPRYTAVELLTAVLFLYVYLKVGVGIKLLQAACFICFLIVIAFIDYDHHIILDSILLYATVTGIGLNVLLPNHFISWPNLLLGAISGAGVLFLIIFLSRGRMGDGDAIFSGVLGLWFGWKYILITLYVSFLLGGVISAVLLLLKKRTGKDGIAFGAILAVAAFFVFVYFKL